MSSSTSSASGGIGLGGLLGTAFIVLKLCGVINWSWLWVLGPFWIPLVIAVAVVLAIVVLKVIVIIAALAFGKKEGGAE